MFRSMTSRNLAVQWELLNVMVKFLNRYFYASMLGIHGFLAHSSEDHLRGSRYTITVSWNVTPWNMVDVNRRCGRTSVSIESLPWELQIAQTECRFVRFELFIAVVWKSIIFWDMTPCSLLSFNWSFGGIYRLHLQGRRNRFSKPASKQVASRMSVGICVGL
jgi:hypothetical protein